jgi:hypothetical protein
MTWGLVRLNNANAATNTVPIANAHRLVSACRDSEIKAAIGRMSTTK